jgi:hypothetical protein
MYSTQVFVYTQRQIVVLLSGFSPRSYMPQYAKPLTLHKGVDNQLQFQFLNQQQKPVDITGKEITCRIIDNTGTIVLVRKALDVQLGLTGIASLYLNPADLEDIDAQKCYYSLEIPVNEFDFPVFVDQNAGARGEMNIVNSVLPSFLPSVQVEIPTGQGYPNTNQIPTNSVVVDGNSAVYYSSVLTTNDNPILTMQVSLADYTGNVVIEGSTNVDTNWYPASDVHSYENETKTVGYTVRGFHPYIRMAFDSSGGAATNIWAR